MLWESLFFSNFSITRGIWPKSFNTNKKLIEVFLKIEKVHAAIEILSVVVRFQASDKRPFQTILVNYPRKKRKDDVLEFPPNFVHSSHEDLNSNVNEDLSILFSYDGT